MTVETVIAFTSSLAILVGSVTALVIQLRALHQQINGRLDQLIALTDSAAHAQGMHDEREAASAASLPISGHRFGEALPIQPVEPRQPAP